MGNEVLGREEVGNSFVSKEGLQNLSPDVKKNVQMLTRRFNKVNNELSDLIQFEVDAVDEMKEINQKINELTAKYKTRKKELRIGIKNGQQQRLIKLGTRESYISQIKELGGKINRLDTKKLIDQTKK